MEEEEKLEVKVKVGIKSTTSQANFIPMVENNLMVVSSIRVADQWLFE